MGRPPNSLNKNGTGLNGKSVNNVNSGNGKKSNCNNFCLSNSNKVTNSQSMLSTDPSQTGLPFQKPINGFASLLKWYQSGTEKMQRLLTDECEIILECRVCRSLFRTLPNYLSHKQMYCEENYRPSSASQYSGIFHKGPLYCFRTTEMKKSDFPSPSSNKSSVNGEYKSKRLEEILSAITPEVQSSRTPKALFDEILHHENEKKRLDCETERVTIEAFPITNRQSEGIAFLRKVEDPTICHVPQYVNKMKVLERDTAVLGPDGKIICIGAQGVIEEIVDRVAAKVEETFEEQQRKSQELNCVYCQTIFDTEKSLRSHIRDAHLGEIKPIITNPDESFKRKASDGTVNKYPNKKSKEYSPGSSSVISAIFKSNKSMLKKSSSQSTTNEVEVDNGNRRGRGRPRKQSISQPIFGVERDESTSSESSVRSSPSSFVSYKRKSMSPATQTSDVEIIEDETLISCNTCSSSFHRRSEMSMHLVHCRGVINLSHFTSPKIPEKKASILLRNDYIKEPKTEIILPRKNGSIISFNNNNNERPSSRTGETLEISDNSQVTSATELVEKEENESISIVTLS